MTDSEKLARWQGWELWGSDEMCHIWITPDNRMKRRAPDYLNDDAAAMSLLDTLVAKGFKVSLEHDNDGWICCYIRDIDKCYIWEDGGYHTTRREAVVAAVLLLLESNQ